MIAYAFLDFDRNLNVRTREYIEVDNPGFWQFNRSMIIAKWKFDTDDMQSMLAMFRQIRDQQVKRETVMNFAASIGFDLASLKELRDASKI